MKKTMRDLKTMSPEEFVSGLDDALADAVRTPLGSKILRTALPGIGVSRLRQMLKVARSDPQGWERRNREDYRRAASRPLIARRLADELPEFTEEEHAGFLSAFHADDETRVATVGEWDEERKARWLAWIERAIPVLRVIGALVPPPYNLAVFALIVVLTLIKERRLQPTEYLLLPRGT